MTTDLLADLFANIRTTTTLAMIVQRIRGAMTLAHVDRCETVDILLEHRHPVAP
jgi:hypothetical protein